jgi:hypothetical protein
MSLFFKKRKRFTLSYFFASKENSLVLIFVLKNEGNFLMALQIKAQEKCDKEYFSRRRNFLLFPGILNK